MNLRADPLAIAQPVTEFLSPGRSPAVWREDLAQACSVAAWMERSCSWPRTLYAVAPRLRSAPLFGVALESLTSEIRRAGGESYRGVTQRRSSDVPAALARNPVRRMGSRPAAMSTAESSRRVERCLEQKPRAGRDLLSRLARNESMESYANERTSRNQSLARVLETAGKAGKSPVPSMARSSRGAAAAAAEACAAIAQGLATTTLEKLSPPEFYPPIPLEAGSAALQEQWSAPLTGDQAPAGLLESRYLDEPTRRPGHGSGQFPRGHSSIPLNEAAPDSAGDRELPLNEVAWTQAREELRRLKQSAGEPGTSRAAAGVEEIVEDMISTSPAGRSGSRISELGRAFRRPDAPSMEVIDAADEDAVSLEELATLSSKLKRILDEEARRHGIDV